ncbi:MAG: hypothetical protein QOD03_1308 [Verrucomicrobiota bacterium]
MSSYPIGDARKVRQFEAMNSCVAKAILLGVACVCGGCQSLERSPKPPPPIQTHEATQAEQPENLKQHLRNNCASLLYDLLNDEKNLSKLLLIKRGSQELDDLVKDISTSCRENAKKLEQLAVADRTLNLHTPGLPSGEAATRDAIAKTKEHDLLLARGADLQFKLLLTQTEGLNYGSHLAKVAAENETHPEAAREFAAIAVELNKLYERVAALLRTPSNL